MSDAQRPVNSTDAAREPKSKALAKRERPMIPAPARVQTWDGVAGVAESSTGASAAGSLTDRRGRELGVACEPMN